MFFKKDLEIESLKMEIKQKKLELKKKKKQKKELAKPNRKEATKFKEALEHADAKELIKMLKKSDILEWQVNWIIEKLNKKNYSEIYEILDKEKIETLIILKGTLMEISEVNKGVDTEFLKIYMTFGITMIVNYIVNILSVVSVKESKFTILFYEGTTKYIVDKQIIMTTVLLLIVTLVLLLPWSINKSRKKLDSAQYVLINMLDFLIEIKKEEKKNKVRQIK